MKKTKVKLKKPTASKTKDGLNHQQEAFCQFYVNNERELFGNGTQCYLEAYGKTNKNGKKITYQTAMVCASQLLRIPKIVNRINSLLETGGFTNENVDKQHLFLLNQHADLKTKMAAVKEYNSLKQRITQKAELVIKDSLTTAQRQRLDELLHNAKQTSTPSND